MLASASTSATPCPGGDVYSTVFVGAGAAGTGPLVCAVQKNAIGGLLDTGIAILDSGAAMLHGTLGQYVVRSDTFGGTFLECLGAEDAGPLSAVWKTGAAAAIAEIRHGPVPLAFVGAYLQQVGQALEGLVDQHPASRFFPRTRAISVRQRSDGWLSTDAMDRSGEGQPLPRRFLSRAVVLATGARQNRQQVLARTIVPGVYLKDYAAKILLTDVVLTPAGVKEVMRRLESAPTAKVVVIGGSHSAFSSLWTLLNLVRGITFQDGDITLLHRGKLKLLYPSREAAIRDGYTDFNDGDICPLTGRVHRLGGLRFDSGELLKRIWGIASAEPESRVAVRRLDPEHDDPVVIRRLLDDAALVIPAFGYRPDVVPVLDVNGSAIELLSHTGGPLVDKGCRVLTADGVPLPHIYGIGLASGFVPSGALGGEPNFTGQTNGLWLYQNGVGEIILNQIQTSPTTRRVAESTSQPCEAGMKVGGGC